MRRIYFVLIPLFVACSGSNTEGEVIDADDFLGETGQLVDTLDTDTVSIMDLGSELNQLWLKCRPCMIQ